MIFEKVLKLAYKGVFYTFVDPDLRHKLLLGARFGQRRLLNQLASEDRLCLLTDKFVALCKPTLAQEFALVVITGTDTSVFKFEFFLNECDCRWLAVHFKCYLNLTPRSLGFWGFGEIGRAHV